LGVTLGRAEQRLIGIEKTGVGATDAAVRRIHRRRFLVQFGGTTALITFGGEVVGEIAEVRRREAVMIASGEPVQWSATHPLRSETSAPD
jgi:hypothetical protein